VKAFLDNFASILGATTVGMLLLSVSHEYGYFWIVGSRFQTFLTTSDYFSNAILWLPWFAVILYVTLDWDVLFGTRRYSTFGWNWSTPLWLIVIIGVPIGAFFFFSPPSATYYIGPAVVLWLMYAPKHLPFANATDEFLIHRIMVVVPVVMAAAFVWGSNQGQSDLTSFAEPYTIVAKGSGNPHRIILRTFDKGILARDTVDNRVEFIKWDDVSDLYRYAPPTANVTLSCSWFGIHCSRQPNIP
jgi:hypothetical protein